MIILIKNNPDNGYMERYTADITKTEIYYVQ